MSNESSESLKSKGNKCFASGDFEQAIQFYTKAISIDPDNSILYSNRSIAHIKAKNFLEAEIDATKAIQLNDTFDKAYFRRGLALKELKRFRLALKDFSTAIKLNDKNVLIKKEYDELKVLLAKEKIKINPITKKSEFQSKVSLGKILIQNGDNLQTNELNNNLFEEFKKELTNKTPKDYHEFERYWRELTNIEDRKLFLQNIDVCAFDAIFKYHIEPKMLNEILEVLSCSLATESTFKIMKSITMMPRFDITICFMTEHERQLIKLILHKLQQAENNHDVQSLQKLFNC